MASPDGLSSPFSVQGKTAIITGAGSGINLAFASLLLTQNCNVVIADIALRPEARELVDAHQNGQPRAVFVKTDVRLWPELEVMFDTAKEHFGGTDIVCPGAGVFEPEWSNFWRPPGSARSRDSVQGIDGVGHYALLDINVTHPIRTTQLAISHWLNPPEGGGGGKVSVQNPKRIVHISSIAGQLPGFAQPLYVASKHAISGFIRSMARLDSIGIRVNGVAPGIIKTPLWTDHPENMKMLNEKNDVWVTPEDVALAMLRCCEDDTIGGGVVLEVLQGHTRHVGVRNDPGPTGPGASVSNTDAVYDDVWALLGDNWGRM